jgi:anaerobic magnesium-protoporphyrin IX monomethyl ester cyclase
MYRDGTAIRSTAARAELADLDTLPFPDWDMFPMDIYFRTVVDHKTDSKWDDGHKDEQVFQQQFREIAMISSRGCPYLCTYCYHHHMGKAYRYRSARNLVDEIIMLKKKFNIQSVQFLDDCFVINTDRVFEFCEILLKEKIGIKWGCNGRVNIVNAAMFERMKAAGCTNVDYGIESGSQKILDVMKKRVTVQQAKDALLLTRAHFGDAGAHWNFTMMVGTPGETRETVQESIDFCKSLNMKPDAVFFTTAFPGTELYDIAKQRGLIRDEEEYVSNLWEMGEQMLLNFTDMPDQELIALKEYMVREVGAGNIYTHEKIDY